MMDSWKKQLGSTKLLILLLTVAVFIYLLQISWQVLGIFSDAFIILFFAWILSLLLGPSVEKLSAFTKFSRGIAAGIIYALFFGLLTLTIVLFIPAITTQIQTLAKILPHYLNSSPDFVNKLSNDALSYLEG